MSENHSIQSEIEAAEVILDELAAEISGHQAPKFKFTKRQYGGYFVEYKGLRLGWLVQSYDTKLWDAYFSGMTAGKGSNAAFDQKTRAWAAEDLARNVSKTSGLWSDRPEFLAGMERRLEDEARIARILAD